MKKRMITLLCAVALLMGIFILAPMTPEAEAAAAVANYQVGFARVDINPYVEDGNYDSGIMALPLYGSGDVWNRLSTAGLVDDNGDGKVTKDDGLKATCIAVTDYKGNTVLLITVDLIGGLQATRVRNSVMERVNAAIASGEVKNVVMDISRIYYTGTHTHNAPQADAYASSGRTDFNNDGVDLNVVNTNLGIWIDRTVEDIADAAILALKDRAEATVTKDSVAASACTDAAVKGKVMNSVRHYVAEDKGCVAGDNFNDRGSNPKQVTQVNDVMQLLQFSFTDETKLPIVIANWTGHPSLNNSNSYKQSSKNCISSDFVSAFRWTLERKLTVNAQSKLMTNTNTQYYRVAFFQGAGGNVNPRGYEKVNGTAVYSWIDNNAKTQNTSRGVAYGRVLSAMAKNGLTTSGGRSTVEAGEIRTLRYYKNVVRNATGVSALAYEAAKYYQENIKEGTYVYTSPDTGEKYVIGSKFHASSLTSKWNVGLQTPADSNYAMEINTVCIGEDLAFVTGSGELFDYYYKENGVFTPENNAWRDLVNGDTYGTPFVLELCNGMNGYVPNYYAYDYNLGSTKWARGSYEAHTTGYSQGTGEDMIKIMRVMLDALADGTDANRTAPCQHCGVTVQWRPYDGKTALENNGHYYLLADNYTPQIHVKNNITVCFDMNGHTLSGETRVFYTVSGDSSTLNLMDSSPNQTGSVRGCAGATGAGGGFGGGAILVDKGNTLNLYSGNLEFYQKGINTVSSGGVVYVASGATMNMYGGTIHGGCAYSFAGEYLSNGVKSAQRSAVGGTMYLAGTLNMYGGTIENGTLKQVTGYITQDRYDNDLYNYTVEDKVGNGPCIYSAKGKVNVAGDAKVADIYFNAAPSGYFTVDGTFTGKVNMSYNSELSSDRVAKCTENTEILPGSLTYSFGDVETVVGDNYITIVAGAITKGVESGVHYYTTLADALRDYRDSKTTYIRLRNHVGENVTVEKDTNLDLYGYSLDGDITVAKGATLYCMDYYTDDYNVSDDNYGRLTGVITGNVEGVAPMTVSPLKSGYRAGYMKVNEKDGVSFHRVELQISKMSLRPDCAGVYYQSPFKGDQVVAKKVKSFGICLSVESADGAKTMLPGTYTAYTGFASGSNGNAKASTLVANVLKTQNGLAQNIANSQMQIYACAYLQTEDGFVFGIPVARSLRQQITDIDGVWDKLTDTQKAAVNKLYNTYKDLMQLWALSKIGSVEGVQ